ncbi:MAG: NtrZ family periplasmic regulatory protein [Caulobacterales bacterium]
MARTLAGAFAVAIAAGAVACADPARAAPATDAFAQSSDVAPQPNQIGPAAPHRTWQFDSRKNRWGFVVDMNQPAGREMQWSDTRIGLNYRVAPGLRTGVGVSLGAEQVPDGRKLDQQGPAPRVRLETTFKF